MAIFYPPPQPFVGGHQPLAPRRLLSFNDLRPPNPPFAHQGRWEEQTRITRIWWDVPPPSPFIGGQQPLAPRRLLSFDNLRPPNPPFAHQGRWEEQQAIGRIWQLPPDPYQQPRKFAIQAAPAVVNDPPFGIPNPQLWALLRSWLPPAPQPQRQYPKQIVSVPVDNPPFPGADEHLNLLQQIILRTWQPGDPLPTLNRKLIQEIASNPYRRAWLETVLNAWQPLEWRQPIYPKVIVSVDNPPPLRRDARQWPMPEWTPQPRLPTQIQSVDQPPGNLNAWLTTVLRSWQPGDPLPALPAHLVPLDIGGADNPPFGLRLWLETVLRSWQIEVVTPTRYPRLTPSGPASSRRQDGWRRIERDDREVMELVFLLLPHLSRWEH